MLIPHAHETQQGEANVNLEPVGQLSLKSSDLGTAHLLDSGASQDERGEPRPPLVLALGDMMSFCPAEAH